MDTAKIFKALVVLGVPGVALGVFYLLLRGFGFQFETIDATWAAIIAIIFLIVVGGVTLFALHRFAPTASEQVSGPQQIPHAKDQLPTKVIKILFLAANPTDSTPLRLDEEGRAIDQKLRQTDRRDDFEVKQQWAVRAADLQGYLLRHQPDIVHFSGHGGTSSEIILEDESGSSQAVSGAALSNLFSLLKGNIKCVVLNACYSETQAQAIADHIDCVVGMSKAIGDKAAISFAEAFYQALGYGKSVQEAFDLGRNQIDLEGLDEQDTPKLLVKKNNAKQIVFQDTSPKTISPGERSGGERRKLDPKVIIGSLLSLLILTVSIIAISLLGLTSAFNRPDTLSSMANMPENGFNIAAVEFVDNTSELDQNVARIVFSHLQETLEEEYDKSEFDDVNIKFYNIEDFFLDQEISFVKVGDTDRIERFAQDVNAQFVIYGKVVVVREIVNVDPKCQIPENFRAKADVMSAISGRCEINLPSDLALEELTRRDSKVNQEITERYGILIEFSKAIYFLHNTRLAEARIAIEDALSHAEKYDNFRGKEVLYIIASHIALLQEDESGATEFLQKAWAIIETIRDDPEYIGQDYLNEIIARAYLSEGNIQYIKYDCEAALASYEKALEQIGDIHSGVYISEKAHYNMGNIYGWLVQILEEPEDLSDAAVSCRGRIPGNQLDFVEKSLDHYQKVIDSYDRVSDSRSNPSASIMELGARSYYYTGFIYYYIDNRDKANEAFDNCSQIKQKFEPNELQCNPPNLK